jgi:sugar lactone lactonase YvrE
MEYPIRIFLFALIGSVILGTISCKNKDQSFDFTEEGVFTKGIEGPAVDSKGNLYAVNFEKEGTIGIVDQKGKGSIFSILPQGSIGNGIRFDKDDNMYIADYSNHNILKIENGSNDAIIYASDTIVNQPNDIAISPNGTLYASDPNWKEATGNLWKIDDKGFQLLESDMGTTNGIEVSPDGRKLYVNESVQLKIWVYEINKHGNISKKKLFYAFDDYGLDGMRCDNEGNLYVCRYGAGKIVVINPNAELIREIKLIGLNPSNITFGGKDKKQCFITMADRGCIESFYSEHPGKEF